MAEATTKVQARAIGTRILRLLSDILNSIADDFDLKADVADVKNYVRNIQPTSNGVKFLDGNGNVICTLTNASQVEKSDPQLSISPKTLTLTVNQSSDVTVTRLGDGVISATLFDGSDCATATVSDTTITFSAVHVGAGTYQVNVADSANYTAASDTVTIAVNKLSPNLTLAPTTIEINPAKIYSTSPGSVTATYSGNGALTAACNTTDLAFTVNNKTINLSAGSSYFNNLDETNTYTVTATVGETSEYYSDTATFTVNADFAVPLINEYDYFSAISAEANAAIQDYNDNGTVADFMSTWFSDLGVPEGESNQINNGILVYVFPEGSAEAYTQDSSVYFKITTEQLTETDTTYYIVYAPMTGDETSVGELVWYNGESVTIVDDSALAFTMPEFDFESYSYVMIAVIEYRE